MAPFKLSSFLRPPLLITLFLTWVHVPSMRLVCAPDSGPTKLLDWLTSVLLQHFQQQPSRHFVVERLLIIMYWRQVVHLLGQDSNIEQILGTVISL